jgi:4-hydroxybutyrate dehydrogenase
MMQGDFDFPTRVVFGAGRVRELPELVAGWGAQALIVTDAGVRRTGTLQPVLDALGRSELDFRVFDDVDANLTTENIEAGLRRFAEDCDFLIAVGGGSPMDAAKVLRLRAAGAHAFRAAKETPVRVPPSALPPLVCIPTTAGTGSEVARSATITIDGRTAVLSGPHLLPNLALCDPELTRDLPALLTAGTGAHAIAHNVEAFFAAPFHPVCDAIALEGMCRGARALLAAVEDGLDLEARAEMMLAALMGGIAMQKGLGAVRSLAHPLSAVAGVQHGIGSAVMLPHVLRFNREAVASGAGKVAAALCV